MSNELPRHFHIALANAQRALETSNYAALATINENLQPVMDTAVSKILDARRDVSQIRAELEALRAEHDALLVERTGMDAAGWEQEAESHAAFMRDENRGGGAVSCPGCNRIRFVDGAADIDISPALCSSCELEALRNQVRLRLPDTLPRTYEVVDVCIRQEVLIQRGVHPDALDTYAQPRHGFWTGYHWIVDHQQFATSEVQGWRPIVPAP